MKALVILLVLVALIGGGLYASGMFSMPSPEEDAQKVKDLVKSKANWEALADLNPPRKYRAIDHGNMTGRGAEQVFEKGKVAEIFAKKGAPEGLAFEYHMSEDIAFEVLVAPDGKLDEVQDLPTMKSLMTPR